MNLALSEWLQPRSKARVSHAKAHTTTLCVCGRWHRYDLRPGLRGHGLRMRLAKERVRVRSEPRQNFRQAIAETITGFVCLRADATGTQGSTFTIEVIIRELNDYLWAATPGRTFMSIFAGILTLLAQCASAATYYVATTGSDSNLGTHDWIRS